MEMQAVLVGVNSFDFPDKATGALIQGCRVRCLTRVSGERRASAVGSEVVEYRAPFGITRELLRDAEKVLGDESLADCILVGEFAKMGKTMQFEVHGIRSVE